MNHGRQSSPHQGGPSAPQQQQQGQRLWRGFRLVFIPRSLALMLHEDHQELLTRLDQLERKIMAQMDEILAVFRQFVADLKAREQNVQARIDAAVAKALADDEIKDTAAAQTLADEIAAARTEFPPVEPPVLPGASNQA